MDLHAFLFWVIGGLTAACAVATVVTHNVVRAATWLLFTLAGTSGLFFLIGADLVGAIQLLVYVGGTMVLVVFGVMLTAQGPFISMRTSSAEWAVSAATGIALLSLLLLSFMGKKVGLNPQGPNEAVVAFAPASNLSDDAATSPYTMVIGQGFAGVGVGPAHKDPAHRIDPPAPEKKAAPEPPLADEPEGQGKKNAKIDDLDANLKNLPAKADDHGKKADAVTPIDPASVVRMNYLLPFEIVSVHLLVVLIAAAYLARAKRWEGRL